MLRSGNQASCETMGPLRTAIHRPRRKEGAYTATKRLFDEHSSDYF